MDTSSQMMVFVKVVELGSISAAARAMGLTPSAVSKQVGQLEDHAGHRLFHHQRTGVSLTDEGREYFPKCKAVAEKYHDAEDHIQNLKGDPFGTLQVASSVAFGKSQLIKVLPDFLAAYPKISVSLELTDRQVDVEEENFDLAITFAEQLTNSNVISRKIMANTRVICAAPEFIARYGTPKDFQDLQNFNCLRTSNLVGRNAWQTTLDGQTITVDATGNFEGNSADAVYMARRTRVFIDYLVQRFHA